MPETRRRGTPVPPAMAFKPAYLFGLRVFSFALPTFRPPSHVRGYVGAIPPLSVSKKVDPMLQPSATHYVGRLAEPGS